VIHDKLGRTGLKAPAVAFGCGSVLGLMTGTDFAVQFATVRHLLPLLNSRKNEGPQQLDPAA
jgi:hypothetical protein